MTNVFEQTDRQHLVLRNDEEQYCLWPASFAVPQGWTQVFGPAQRDSCTAMIRENWTDMRPRSLREALEAEPPQHRSHDVDTSALFVPERATRAKNRVMCMAG